MIEKEDLSEREEKILIGLQNSIYHSVNDYITVSSNKRGSISISINEIKSLICACAGIGNTMDNRFEDKFFEKLTKYILSDIHIPSGDAPDNMYASEHIPLFSDYLMSPIKFWETKRTHLRKHIIGLQRLNKAAMKKRTTQELDLSNPEDRLIFRRKSEKYLLWKRYNNLRMSMRNYLLRSFALVVYLFEPANIGHEKLSFSQNSMSGFLKLIVDSMFDNLDEFTEIIENWTRSKKYTPKFVPVNAQNTSKYLFTLKILKNIPSKFCIIDRSMSYDYSYIKLAPEILIENDSESEDFDEKMEKIKIIIKGKIIEAHFEAAATIAWRAFIEVIDPSIISLILYNKYGEG